MNKPISINVRMATDDDADLPSYDNTKLQAINTCPTWGIVRYVKHKKYETVARAMALEAGGAMHEVFAAVRLWQLCYHTLIDQPTEYIQSMWNFHGKRLFGEDRFPAMCEALEGPEDDRTKRNNFCVAALYTSGYYDDPRDKRRTLANLEEAAYLYLERYDYDRYPIWVRDLSDPTSDVGIEIAFNVVIEFEFESEQGDRYARLYRFTGKLDGIHLDKGELSIGENKTASRLDEAWRQSFEVSSQVTGYMLAASVFSGMSAIKGNVYGLQIPLPKDLNLGGNERNPCSRESFHFERWFDWFLHTVDIAERYEEDILHAPKYTHSCNRYFRPCALIPYCASDDEEQIRALDEMVIDEWSPLHELEVKAGD